MKSHKVFLGTCVQDEIVEHIFGSVSEFARQVELNGNEFEYDGYIVTYYEDTDTHSFWIK